MSAIRAQRSVPKYNNMPATPEQYFQLKDDGFRYELINGRLVMVPAPTLKHQDISLEMAMNIRAFLRTNPIGVVLAAPCDVRLGDEVYQPDIIFVRNDNFDIITEKRIIGAPDLLVEILSPGTMGNDFGIKFYHYEMCGVKEYWIIHPNTGECHFFILTGERFEEIVPTGNHYQSRVLSGYVLDLEELRKYISTSLMSTIGK